MCLIRSWRWFWQRGKGYSEEKLLPWWQAQGLFLFSSHSLIRSAEQPITAISPTDFSQKANNNGQVVPTVRDTQQQLWPQTLTEGPETVWPLMWCVGAHSTSAGCAHHVTPWTYNDNNVPIINCWIWKRVHKKFIYCGSKSMRFSVLMSSEHYQ